VDGWRDLDGLIDGTDEQPPLPAPNIRARGGEELEVIMELLIDIRPTRLGPTQGRRVKKSTIQPIKGKSTVTTVYKVTIDETSKGMAELVHKTSEVFINQMKNKNESNLNIQEPDSVWRPYIIDRNGTLREDSVKVPNPMKNN
jgi:hypothetical protein